MPNSTMRKPNPLRVFLDERGIRYVWVAERLGISPSHLTRLMDSDRPLTASMAQRLADLFSEPITTFLSDPEAK